MLEKNDTLLKIQNVLSESGLLLIKDKELALKIEKQRNQLNSLDVAKESFTVLNHSLKNHINDLKNENAQFKALLRNLNAIK